MAISTEYCNFDCLSRGVEWWKLIAESCSETHQQVRGECAGPALLPCPALPIKPRNLCCVFGDAKPPKTAFCAFIPCQNVVVVAVVMVVVVVVAAVQVVVVVVVVVAAVVGVRSAISKDSGFGWVLRLRCCHPHPLSLEIWRGSKAGFK